MTAGVHQVSASFVDSPWEREGVTQPIQVDFGRGSDEYFDGYAAVLVRLDELEPAALTELVGEAWACRAPKRLLDEHPSRPPRA